MLGSSFRSCSKAFSASAYFPAASAVCPASEIRSTESLAWEWAVIWKLPKTRTRITEKMKQFTSRVYLKRDPASGKAGGALVAWDDVRTQSCRQTARSEEVEQ